eukprot:SAG31_NODE_37216_length_306_cov_0.753623_1_plen_75_part_10
MYQNCQADCGGYNVAKTGQRQTGEAKQSCIEVNVAWADLTHRQLVAPPRQHCALDNFQTELKAMPQQVVPETCFT